MWASASLVIKLVEILIDIHKGLDYDFFAGNAVRLISSDKAEVSTHHIHFSQQFYLFDSPSSSQTLTDYKR